jgi:hypothetical protein
MYHSSVTGPAALDVAGDLDWPIAAPVPSHKARRARPPACTMRPLRVADVARALRIAVTNFGSEVNLVARSYVWHFAKRAGLEDVSAMWSTREVRIVSPTGKVAFNCIQSFVHGRDVAWLDLADIDDADADVALDGLRQWPRCHRLLVIRVNAELMPFFVAAGFELAGSIPHGRHRHLYMYATRRRLAQARREGVVVHFGARELPRADCEFSVVERDGAIIGLSGIYEVEFWQGVTWGAWGAMDPAAARRDAVFDTLRLTEARAKGQGAAWFCLETSDSAKYRHARRIYELYGLQPMLRIPGFYCDGGSAGDEAFIVYGMALGCRPTDLPRPASASGAVLSGV